MSAFSEINVEEYAKKHGLSKGQTLELMSLWAHELSLHSSARLAPQEHSQREIEIYKAIDEADELTAKAFADMLETLVRKLEQEMEG